MKMKIGNAVELKFIKDSLHSCTVDTQYGRGCLTGLVNGLMAYGNTLADAIRIMRTAFDAIERKGLLSEASIVTCMPDSWVPEWKRVGEALKKQRGAH